MEFKYKATRLACYIGYIVQAIINNFLPILFIALQDVYGLGYEKLARLVVFNFATQIVTFWSFTSGNTAEDNTSISCNNYFHNYLRFRQWTY